MSYYICYGGREVQSRFALQSALRTQFALRSFARASQFAHSPADRLVRRTALSCGRFSPADRPVPVEIDGKDDFEIHTNVKRGLFDSHSTLEMEIFVKGINESEGMRVMRTYFHQRLQDEMNGFSKVKRDEGESA